MPERHEDDWRRREDHSRSTGMPSQKRQLQNAALLWSWVKQFRPPGNGLLRVAEGGMPPSARTQIYALGERATIRRIRAGCSRAWARMPSKQGCGRSGAQVTMNSARVLFLSLIRRPARREGIVMRTRYRNCPSVEGAPLEMCTFIGSLKSRRKAGSVLMLASTRSKTGCVCGSSPLQLA